MRTVGIGIQDFEIIRKNNYFYVDKTGFVKEWWENGDSVTLIARPRRFGKTLTMDMIEKFLSVKYAGRSGLFAGLEIWKDKKYRELQGTYPVIFLSFANVKEGTYEEARLKIGKLIQLLYNKYDFLLEGNVLNENEKNDFRNISENLPNYKMTLSIQQLSCYLQR